MKQKRSLLFTLAVVAIVGAVWFFVFLIVPRTETLDQRVHDVASQLKCLVCQGESVADSPAPLSQQMRGVIRQQLQNGKSEQEVIQYFVDRYGDRILLSPPWQGFSLLAWLVPIAMLLGGVILLFFVLKDWNVLSRSNAVRDDSELTKVDEGELERYRVELEQELAADDPLFAQPGTEAS
jgi:cytochrome c-type biogenesis protein CcmH